MDWNLEPWQRDLWAITRRLLELRRDNPALRPARFGVDGQTVDGALQVGWFNERGERMRAGEWDSIRTVQYAAAADAGAESANRVLLIVHGQDREAEVTLPRQPGVRAYARAWDSAQDTATGSAAVASEPVAPGAVVPVSPMSLQLFIAS
jgi:glycogen operon protein